MHSRFTDNLSLSLPDRLAAAEKQFQQCLAVFQSRQAVLGERGTENDVMDSVPGFSQSGLMDNLLSLLLNLMNIKFRLDHEYRENIKNFDARYVFQDKAGKIYQQVIFTGGKMVVSAEKSRVTPTFTLTFRDSSALHKLLFAPAPDILEALLNQEVDFTGNINYLNKFAFMALQAKPKLSF